MSDKHADSAAVPLPSPQRIWARVWSIGQFLLSLGLTLAFLAYLLFVPDPLKPGDSEQAAPARPEIVSLVGPGLIRVQPGSPLDKKIQVVPVRKGTISDPVMMVTGRVIASLRPGHGKKEDYWQFDSPDLLAAHTDWEKAQADIVFSETQLEQVKQLAATRLKAQREVVQRMEKLVAAGTDTVKDLTAERANLIQVEITGRQEVHQAETAVRVAKRDEAAQARKLQQAGLDPELLKIATSDMDIVVADVPEGRINQVRVGQSCLATFFGLPRERFPGKVRSISPVLSIERRSLRVLFVIDDPDDKLRPGMFAEIGLGTDSREALLIPADAILHLGRSDYVLVAQGDNTWAIREVQVGEPHLNEIEILSGLSHEEQVIGKGAILFKPVVVRSLRSSEGR